MSQVHRGLPTPTPEPTTGPRNRGVGDLRNTVAPSGKPRPNGAIPAAEESAIKQLETAAIDGTTAGADDLPQDPRFAPGSHRDNIPMGVGNLIADSSINVP